MGGAHVRVATPATAVLVPMLALFAENATVPVNEVSVHVTVSRTASPNTGLVVLDAMEIVACATGVITTGVDVVIIY